MNFIEKCFPCFCCPFETKNNEAENEIQEEIGRIEKDKISTFSIQVINGSKVEIHPSLQETNFDFSQSLNKGSIKRYLDKRGKEDTQEAAPPFEVPVEKKEGDLNEQAPAILPTKISKLKNFKK